MHIYLGLYTCFLWVLIFFNVFNCDGLLWLQLKRRKNAFVAWWFVSVIVIFVCTRMCMFIYVIKLVFSNFLDMSSYIPLSKWFTASSYWVILGLILVVF